MILILFSNNFSKSLEIIGSDEIGRYDVNSFRSFPGLGIIVTSAIFHTVGTCLSLNAAFIKLVSLTMPFLGSCFRTPPVISSYPGAFLGFKLVLILVATPWELPVLFPALQRSVALEE